MSAVIRHLAFLLIGLCVLMVFPAFMALADGEHSAAAAFFTPALLTAGLAGGILVALRDLTPPLSRVGSLFLVILTWPCLALVAALPLAGISALTYPSSLFESLSALTTTGMSLLANLDGQPAGKVDKEAALHASAKRGDQKEAKQPEKAQPKQSKQASVAKNTRREAPKQPDIAPNAEKVEPRKPLSWEDKLLDLQQKFKGR